MDATTPIKARPPAINQYAMTCPKRSTSMTVMAASAKPAAMTKGTATEARATYLRTRWLAADFAWLMSPANTVGSLRFPDCAEDKANGCGQREGCHRLVLHRLVDG